jgi:SAM-dependent methyltransferase
LPHLYDPFDEHLPASARILDAGCGVGRDTRHFIEQGHIVISFDASIEMVKKCREYPHAYCIQRSFNEVNFKEEFDGVWANASLVHLIKSDAIKTVSRLATALRPGGTMFISLKEGEGTKQEDDGRFFQYYSEAETTDLYTADGRLSLIKLWKSASAIDNGSDQAVWLNILLKRITA